MKMNNGLMWFFRALRMIEITSGRDEQFVEYKKVWIN